MPVPVTMSADEARAAYQAERERGFTGARWHMRPAGPAAEPARRLDPSDIRVRWRGDTIPELRHVAPAPVVDDLEGLDVDRMEQGAVARRKAVSNCRIVTARSCMVASKIS